ncbi:LysR family transcriptional regulator [Vreelandella neptunia]|uniref:LysR family transcriptional regulator n=1 Tax=Vreelandella neptunia TaxID=115551 RepID=A0ABZ0YII1_9GAMM|nr:LysR family transcriptional regulator [Halomonas neptunia]MDN3561049.1 LysR family transcriptional regulator [Halomonas neptunia]TDW00348.1 DNA-binding transcriptional LysR family regulator [Halomonas alkaliantarctica]WQH11186.1 LysR family transcriptional regulator [Halomonas neptunia]
MTDIIKIARKTNLDTTLLRTLVAISDYGGFSEAAQALHLTQSAVSHHVRRLEEQLGNTFFETYGRRKRFTEAGELFLWYARQILALNDEAFNKLGQRSEVAKEIRLGVSEYFAQDYLPIMLASMRFEKEGVRIIPQLGRSTVLQHKLINGLLDMVIAVDITERPHLNVQEGVQLVDRRLFWVGASDFLLESCNEIPLVAFAPPCILRDLQINELKQSQLPWRIVYEARDLGDLLAAVKAGLGVSALPFTPSQYGLSSPINLQQLPALPDVRISIKTATTVEFNQLEWLIQLIRRCWSLPEQIAENMSY